MPRPELRDLVAVALSALAREAPGHYARLAELLKEFPLELDLEGSAFVLRFAAGAHRLEPPALGRAAGAEVRTGAATILALLDGEQSLVDAALADRLWLRGSVERVARFETALGVFMDGAVRCTEMPGLLRRLRELRAAASCREEKSCPS